MRWIDGSELDPGQFSGKTLCEKLAVEMYEHDREKWSGCDDFIRNALLILDFDTVSNMEGFSTPFDGYFTRDSYAKMIGAFREIGDDRDAEILSEAFRLDAHYTELLESVSSEEESETVYDAFCERIDALEKELYLNSDFDMWALLYAYLERHIRQQTS